MDTFKLNKELIDSVMSHLTKDFTEEERMEVENALNAYEWYEGEKDLAVYEFSVDCGRMGNLEGIFTAKKKDVEWLLNCPYEVYFGEVLGKHSEVYFEIQENHLKMISDDPKEVKSCRKSGFNPFNYTLLSSEEEWEDLTVQEIIDLENDKTT